ncbi:hypothetical protein FE257_008277 [Aspergillus nanangensis]|uniref:Uncharacterized protein n=1 Tax=Aspergillus nanangensis TaxID=2582783 RepID=A0AAD4CM73_ASPNN|nr:hypothetical protein FE257_008277 [Aspergillus nanangensis]
MPGPSRAQVKLACLACRASKTRCDGKRPCTFLDSIMGLVSPLSDVQDTSRNPPDASILESPIVTGHQSTAAANLDFLNTDQVNLLTLRGYETDEDLLVLPCYIAVTMARQKETPILIGAEYRINAYYVFIHPYFPLLPRNAASIYQDCPIGHSLRTGCVDKSLLPSWPSNPFTLSLLSILVLIPHPDDRLANCEEGVELRRSYAELYARAALEAVEDSIERSSSTNHRNRTQNMTDDQSDLHPNVPKKLEPVLSLALLSLYEYCQRGSKSRMRIRANHALTTAMDMGLHSLAPNMPEGFDAHRRAWWMAVFLVYHSSILNDLSPIILADDRRITTPYPEFRGCLEAWPLVVKAHDALLQSFRIARELTNGNNTRRPSNSLKDRIRNLDSCISSLASESDRSRCVTNQQGSESSASRNMWVVARAIIHTSRIALHKFRAFLDHPIPLETGSELKSINDVEYLHNPQSLLPSRTAQIQSIFPFTEQESAKICLKSALVVSRIFRDLPSPNPNYSDTESDQTAETCKTRPGTASAIHGSPRSIPYLACCELQSFYVLVMLLRRVRASAYLGDISSCYYLLANPQPESEVQDAERLLEELRNALISLKTSIQADTVFGGVIETAQMHFFSHYVVAIGLLATALPITQAYATSRSAMPRTVVTTDMEQDDLASLIRYLLYTNELDTQGIIYTSSRYHWAGDGNGTKFFIPDREYTTPQWTWRWTGTRTIQDIVLKAYAQIYPNILCHDPFYPTPDQLLSTVKIGNIDFEGEMDHDTEGSNLIRSLLLDSTDTRPLYLQAWGGTNTIARALKSIEEQYSGSRHWAQTRNAISRKAVILASGFQDNAYTDYIAPHWPQIRVEDLSAGYKTWGYNCNQGQGNERGLPNDNLYFTGDWIKANIQTGPYGKLYRSWLDGQSMPGDAQDTFGNATEAALRDSFCKPLGVYDFLSEGDNVVFNPLLTTGLQDPSDPTLGGWGGRATQNTTSPNLWQMVDSEKNQSGAEIANYTTNRWAAAVQNDFAARMQWTLTPNYERGNHPPSVDILNGTTTRKAHAGSTVTLVGKVHDPDDDSVAVSWWQFFEEGTYPGSVAVTESGHNQVDVTIPDDAKAGATISIVMQGTDSGHFPLTRYSRVFVHVI